MSRFEWLPDRRRDARVDLLADLQGHIVTLDEEVQVRQISRGGMTVETTAPLSPRLVHDFRLSVGERAVVLKGRVMHSRVKIDRDLVTYLAGIQFVDPSPASVAIIGEFLDRFQTDATDR